MEIKNFISETANDRLPEVPEPLLSYYQQLENLLAERLTKLPESYPGTEKTGAGEAVRQLGRESSLEEMGYVPHQAAELAATFREICGLLAECFPEDPLARSLGQASANGEFSEDYWRSTTDLDQKLNKWAEDRRLDPEALLQMAHWAAAPRRRWAANHYREDLAAMVTNERGRCPICGQDADCAFLSDREHGRRYLVCLNCDLSWPYRRLGCTFCDNRDYDHLGYLMPENCGGYKIYFCDQCKGYLKTFDQRDDAPRLAESPLPEYANTLFLDLLAINQGYLPR